MGDDLNTEYGGLTREERLEILRNVGLPGILSVLISKDLVDSEREDDKFYLWNLVNANSELIEEAKFLHVFHEIFIKYAIDAFSNNDDAVGIVLIAVSIEHVLNTNLRNLLTANNLSDEECTTILRTSNIESKLGWVLKLLNEKEIPIDLKRNIQIVFELRNSMVHYKAMPTFLDDRDSIEVLRERIIEIGKDNILELPELLNEYLLGIVNTEDQTRVRINKLVDTMLN